MAVAGGGDLHNYVVVVCNWRVDAPLEVLPWAGRTKMAAANKG